MDGLLDLHNHILPGMDDGCKTPQESLAALQEAARQGVQAVFATPHYYPVEPVEVFLQRRREAADRLSAYVRAQKAAELPQVCLGAEVAFRAGLSNEPALRELALGGTEYLLLELPFHSWGPEVFRQIRSISTNHALTVVLAHLERYVGIVPFDQLRKLLQMDVLVQINAGSFLKLKNRMAVNRLLRHARIDFFGSDCHNLTDRAPKMGELAAYLEKNRLSFMLDYANDQAMQLFEQVKPEYKLSFSESVL